jgi:hypothetical protein
MRTHRWLAAIWVCFLVRGLFYCAALPLWEGFDEWAHFGTASRVALRGELLVSRDSPLPRDIAVSIRSAPMPWELRGFGPTVMAHDEFWRLPSEARERREQQFREIPFDWSQWDDSVWKTYEGLQGPLYYWLMALPLTAARHAHLATQVLLLRCLGLLIASATIPFAYLTGRRVFGSTAVALGCAAVMAAMPGLLIDTAHVSNECLAVALFAATIWLTVEIAADGLTRRRGLALGVVTGLGLITKAYFLTALPVIGVVVLWRRAWVVPIVAALLSAWWYIRNLLTVGAVSGMYESAKLPHTSLADQLRQIVRIPWTATIDSTLFAHLWLGSWSTLQVRSWMYHALYVAIGIGVLGLVRARWSRALAVVVSFVAVFWAGQLYHAITLFMVWGIPTTQGGYLAAIATAEVAVCAAGLRAMACTARRWVLPAGVLLLGALDFYATNFVALPYYTGVVAHRANGMLETFHLGGIGLREFFGRLAAFKAVGPAMIGAAWFAWIAATLALIAIGVGVALHEEVNCLRPKDSATHRLQ